MQWYRQKQSRPNIHLWSVYMNDFHLFYVLVNHASSGCFELFLTTGTSYDVKSSLCASAKHTKWRLVFNRFENESKMKKVSMVVLKSLQHNFKKNCDNLTKFITEPNAMRVYFVIQWEFTGICSVGRGSTTHDVVSKQF